MDLVVEFRYVAQVILQCNFTSTVPRGCCMRNNQNIEINILPCSYITLQWILKSLYSFATKQQLLCVHAVSVYAHTKIFEY